MVAARGCGVMAACVPREVAWRQTTAVLRAYLVDAGIDRERFDEVFGS